MISFAFNYLCKDLVCKYSHMLRSSNMWIWGHSSAHNRCDLHSFRFLFHLVAWAVSSIWDGSHSVLPGQPSPSPTLLTVS